ncbi:MAG: hypothetical protein FWD91_07900 [Treponema sp.]|nr:hypothetical protein [Treponema sp.]
MRSVKKPVNASEKQKWYPSTSLGFKAKLKRFKAVVRQMKNKAGGCFLGGTANWQGGLKNA